MVEPNRRGSRSRHRHHHRPAQRHGRDWHRASSDRIREPQSRGSHIPCRCSSSCAGRRADPDSLHHNPVVVRRDFLTRRHPSSLTPVVGLSSALVPPAWFPIPVAVRKFPPNFVVRLRPILWLAYSTYDLGRRPESLRSSFFPRRFAAPRGRCAPKKPELRLLRCASAPRGSGRPSIGHDGSASPKDGPEAKRKRRTS